MAKTIDIGVGDCLINICRQEGFFWETVWSHPQNKGLRQTRKHLNILKEGDRLYIPDRQVREESGETEKRHRFRLKGHPTRFTLTLLDLGMPRANEKYILKVDGRILAEGNTDANGNLTESIPPGARKGLLLLGEDQSEIIINFGFIDPIEEVSGVQTRLQNLGFYDGEIDDINGPLTTAAIAEFQHSVSISGNGELNDKTRQALILAHGS